MRVNVLYPKLVAAETQQSECYVKNVRYNQRFKIIFAISALCIALKVLVTVVYSDIVDHEFQLCFCSFLALTTPNRHHEGVLYWNSITVSLTVNFCYKAHSPS